WRAASASTVDTAPVGARIVHAPGQPLEVGNLINLLISEDPPVAATVRQIAPSTPGPPNCARSIVGFEAAHNLRASS
ncbi:MAG TPA: hypothetical protein VJ255_01220, partial [Candidatus Acidoferrum sp.]|nr:hypothetical protein [Candidatus Acidoferrum sp.]